MLKKLFITAAAAAAVSVPLAGVAWADRPSDPGSNGSGIGQGGMPKQFGDFADAVGVNPKPGQPLPPGQEVNAAKSRFPGVPTPTAVGKDVNAVYGSIGVQTQFGPTPPGLVVKTFGPGCASGHGATDPGVNDGESICN
jgi:hypothetical protein